MSRTLPFPNSDFFLRCLFSGNDKGDPGIAKVLRSIAQNALWKGMIRACSFWPDLLEIDYEEEAKRKKRRRVSIAPSIIGRFHRNDPFC